ncbi:MAG TPA: class I SAM-dependent methyltransferase [Ktedonobacteraceae bacterium]|jgi:ubiquinone/menaquinone biosynthesis C-methylase UbiE|nr:class I SAM-dependent methyltransferase [Ktedonobacteraceae bacterium]
MLRYLLPLPFEDASFDFVHQRLLMFAVPQLYWQPLVNELARVTGPNGWVELVEVNPFLKNSGPATGRVVDLIVQFSRQRTLDPDIAQHIDPFLRAAGLKHVEMMTREIPVGKWGEQPGVMALRDIVTIVQAMKPLVTVQMQMSSKAFDALVKEMEQEVEQYHTTVTFHIAYGRRK